MKDLSERNLDDEIDALDPRPVFRNPPLFIHQKVCFLIGVCLESFLYLLDMGTGKTRIVLEVIKYRKLSGSLKGAALVLVPNVINIESWCIEAQKFAPELKVVPLYGSTEDRRWLLEREADLFIINYQGLLRLAGKKRKAPTKKKKTFDVDMKKVTELAKRFGLLVFDESTALKKHTSLTYRVCHALARRCGHKYALTGTPFGRDPTDLWSQFKAIDEGATLGETLGLFREAFFKKSEGYWTKYKYEFNPKKERLFHNIIKNLSISYDLDDCVDMPGSSKVPVRVYFPAGTEVYYQKQLERVQKAKGNLQLLESVFTNMRMLSSGYLSAKQEDGTRIEVEFDENPKMDALLEILQAMAPNRKIVVVHEYIKTGRMIADRLKKEGFHCLELRGETKDKPGVLRKFNDNPKYNVLIMNHQAGSKGLNLQVASYMAFFESPASPIDRKQTERRIYRPGQQHKVVYFDLIMKDTMDERILRYLENGESLFRALIKGVEKWERKSRKVLSR